MPARRHVLSWLAGCGVAAVLPPLLTPDEARAAGPLALAHRVRFGAHVEGMVADPAALGRWEQQAGRRSAIASYFYGYGDEFPAAVERAFADDGRRDVLLSWDMGPTRFSEWTAGAHDDYLLRIAAHARSYPYDVHVRPWPEMNGDWQDFQPTATGTRPRGGTPAEFVAAWRHVTTTVRRAGGTNVKWVFNPTADTYAETTDVRTIWPGAAHVDVLGLDGYNWGDGGRLEWREFEDIFAEQYGRLTALHPSAPVWICEYGCKEPGVDDGAPADPRHTKAQWLRGMLTSRRFERLEAVVSFEVRKERDWRTTSSPEAMQVWRESQLTPAPLATVPRRSRSVAVRGPR
ncbi:glycoside hydrolase family 26 protein [Kineococcus sp. SYSU DK006]|uniref:glycoside hydrolase family 26 protein n=1 Tax=Kineococcus sp. SYSU DK006 TaxID=3383127 RepID=UPI003D7D27EA